MDEHLRSEMDEQSGEKGGGFLLTSIHLGIDFDMGISWNHFVGNGNAITNLGDNHQQVAKM